MDEWVQGRREKLIKESMDEGKQVWKHEGRNVWIEGGRKERAKGWKEEGIDPRSDRKGAETSNIDLKIYLKRVPKSIKIVPKSTQKSPKMKPRWAKNQHNAFKTILDIPGWRFPGYPLVAMELSWVPKSSQIRKKNDAKNRWFFDRSWKRRKWEKGS